MKNTQKIILILTLVNFITACKNKDTNQSYSQIKFEIGEYDFGELALKSEARCNFEYTNTGKTPVIIQQVKTSCGCIATKWSNKPLKPGKVNRINVEYDASHPGIFHKTITVYFNGKESPIILKVKGQVEYPDDL